MFDKYKPSKTFEIDIAIRDSKGNLTEKRRQYSSNNAYKIWEFYNRFQGKPRRKKKHSKAASKEQAEKVVKTMYDDNKE